jgi:copper chaperone
MIRFAVPDMSCKHCVAAITRAVQEVDPAAQVATDLDTHTVQIESRHSSDALAAAITEAGFTVDPAA